MAAAAALLLGGYHLSFAETDVNTALQMVLIDPSMRDDALIAMIDPVTEEDVGMLVEALSGPLEACRLKAAALLGKVGGEAAIGPLEAMARGEDPKMAAVALDALIAIGPPAIVPLCGIVEDPKTAPETRAKVLAAVVAWDHPRVLACLAAILRKPLPGSDQNRAAAALRRRGLPGCIELVAAHEGVGVEPGQRHNAALSARAFLGAIPREELLRTCFLPILEPETVAGVDSGKRSALVAYGIRRLSAVEGSREAILESWGERLVACVRIAFLPSGEEPAVRAAAASAVQSLRERGILEVSEGEVPRLRASLAGHTAIAEGLAALAAEKEARRAEAAQRTAQLGGPMRMPSRHPRSEGTIRFPFSRAGCEKEIEALRSRDAASRAQAARTIGEMRCPDAVGALIDLARSTVPPKTMVVKRFVAKVNPSYDAQQHLDWIQQIAHLEKLHSQAVGQRETARASELAAELREAREDRPEVDRYLSETVDSEAVVAETANQTAVSEYRSVMVAAVGALGMLCGDEASAYLGKLFRGEEDQSVVRAAADALLRCGGRDFLATIAADPRGGVQVEAARAALAGK